MTRERSSCTKAQVVPEKQRSQREVRGRRREMCVIYCETRNRGEREKDILETENVLEDKARVVAEERGVVVARHKS